MKKILLDWEIKRIKKNVYTWKDRIAFNPRADEHNYGITLKFHTKNNGQIFFTLNNSEILELIKQKEIEHLERQNELNKSVNEYIKNFWL